MLELSNLHLKVILVPSSQFCLSGVPFFEDSKAFSQFLPQVQRKVGIHNHRLTGASDAHQIRSTCEILPSPGNKSPASIVVMMHKAGCHFSS